MPASEPRSERPILGGLVLFGVLAIVLGVMNLQRAITAPTAGQRAATNAPSEAPLTPEEFEQQQRAVLAATDTDGDGLSDLDELERTRTSPYLADSDSDGIPDKAEVDAGEDPNCPRGQTCAEFPRAEAAPERAAPSASAMEGPSVPPASAFTDLLTKGLPSGDATSAGSTNLVDLLRSVPRDAAQIRTLLGVNGLPQDRIAALDDAAVLALWDQMIEALAKAQSAAATNAPAASSP